MDTETVLGRTTARQEPNLNRIKERGKRCSTQLMSYSKWCDFDGMRFKTECFEEGERENEKKQ